jgi:hypothetical protein
MDLQMSETGKERQLDLLRGYLNQQSNDIPTTKSYSITTKSKNATIFIATELKIDL